MTTVKGTGGECEWDSMRTGSREKGSLWGGSVNGPKDPLDLSIFVRSRPPGCGLDNAVNPAVSWVSLSSLFNLFLLARPLCNVVNPARARVSLPNNLFALSAAL